ncbi:type II toxin-antitoxin system death-on-curing family toxin [Patescibacteria group bacterium]|nr:type II toxin-antitoxin system death-on-curing family toxin [Patescibacteria group bacterium]MBU1472875.1 type II toxin-antitoxin system death-on-curing family toxin [Patescibacteria group bacterium]MBU2460063.1 type II toxin-antitoxin system death-on-curing family toxin [Patescibacteria group bacterium]MBU2544759.1 type II toxin-antitoxin system death-on-curing family toxin [Patescibacteria group bacterium]
MIKYLTTEDVLLLHHLSIEKSGGSHGLRDAGLLDSAVQRPKASFAGVDLYPSIFAKAGALCHSLIKNHAFVDGNKRTSLLSAMTMLELNGFRFECEQEELVVFGLKIDNESITAEEVSRWLKSHSKKK